MLYGKFGFVGFMGKVNVDLFFFLLIVGLKWCLIWLIWKVFGFMVCVVGVGSGCCWIFLWIGRFIFCEFWVVEVVEVFIGLFCVLLFLVGVGFDECENL